MEWCVTPEQNQFLSPFFWVTFVVVSALVMLSLFIGAVTMSMTESMEQMKEEEEEATKKRMKEKQMAKMRAAQEANIARRNSELLLAANAELEEEKTEKKGVLGVLGFGENPKDKEQEQKQMTNMLLSVWDGVDLDEMMNRVRDAEVEGKPIRMLYYHLSLVMKR